MTRSAPRSSPTRASRRSGFTGSRAGGLALVDIARQRRAEPIPVYAEMSSVNPVLLFPAALAARKGRARWRVLMSVRSRSAPASSAPIPASSSRLAGPDLDRFVAAAAAKALAGTAQPQVMLTPGIHAQL
jgi:alpha-ketoglutaric semialdehyde dehydrogenase